MVNELGDLLEPGDIVIDGGNSYYRDDVDRAVMLKPKGIHYVDVGTSGGVFGLERGFCLMIGGEDDVVKHLDPIFKSIAPGVESAERTPGRTGEPTQAEHGYLHCGPPGAGHFVKMVHNGVEYGLMAAYAEGLNIIKNADIGKKEHEVDAETSPLRDPQYYQYEINIGDVAEVWRRGSVVASWLIDLTAAAFVDDPALDGLPRSSLRLGRGPVDRAGSRRRGRAQPRHHASLYDRFESRQNALFANKVLGGDAAAVRRPRREEGLAGRRRRAAQCAARVREVPIAERSEQEPIEAKRRAATNSARWARGRESGIGRVDRPRRRLAPAVVVDELAQGAASHRAVVPLRPSERDRRAQRRAVGDAEQRAELGPPRTRANR